MVIADAKSKGAYYTPTEVAACLVKWAVRKESDRLLDPSCGDGQFLALHKNAAGIEQDTTAVAIATERTGARIYVGDFFDWAERTRERFDCTVGNPPFIRYQRFAGETRDRALRLCKRLGVSFTALTASWAPFLVGASSLLRPGGRMAFVVPAEIGHASYCAPLVEYLLRSFSTVQLVAIRDSVFPGLSQDVWLLCADGFGGATSAIAFTAWEQFRLTSRPPQPDILVHMSEWHRWRSRLRPFILPCEIRELYQELRAAPGAFQFGEVARVGIGYVTGANDFFHLRPSVAKKLGIPPKFLVPSVRNGRTLPSTTVDKATVKHWIDSDDPCMLLRIAPKDEFPAQVRRYLDSEDGRNARTSYKCRNRDPWYSVPDVTVPDGFLGYMSNRNPGLVTNAAGCVCTNSLHAVRMTNGCKLAALQRNWQHPLTVLSTEIEGHPLGGGMLKLEPREASRVIFPGGKRVIKVKELDILNAGTTILRTWRHHA